MHTLPIRSSILLTTALVLLVGCGGGEPEGPPIGYVEGTVTLDGKPLKGVIVGFEPQGTTSGAPSMGATDAEGHYELTYSASEKGAAIGTHKVTVTTPSDAPTPSGEEYVDPIPAKYNTASELIKEVKEGNNVLDLELTSQ